MKNEIRKIYRDALRTGRSQLGKFHNPPPVWPSLVVFGLVAAIIIILCGNASASPNNGLKQAILTVARAELGRGEAGGNNRGQDVRKYTKGKEVAWCAGFASYTLKKAGITTVKYDLSARSLFNQLKAQKRLVKTPRPGDLVFFNRGARNSWTAHVGIVEKVEGDNIVTIEGNSGKFPAKVKRISYKKNQMKNLLGFGRVV